MSKSHRIPPLLAALVGALLSFTVTAADYAEVDRIVAVVDDGVIVIVAKNDRRLRIEVGYGLEGGLNDAVAHRIIAETIVPRLREISHRLMDHRRVRRLQHNAMAAAAAHARQEFHQRRILDPGERLQQLPAALGAGEVRAAREDRRLDRRGVAERAALGRPRRR